MISLPNGDIGCSEAMDIDGDVQSIHVNRDVANNLLLSE